MLGSSDSSALIVSTHPPEGPLFDFGHIDLFIGENAPELVWEPIFDWIEDH